MQLVTAAQRRQLLAQGKASAENTADEPLRHKPIVKIFGGSGTWLISEMDPDEPDRLFGLCDLGMGYPEMGYVLLSELQAARMQPFGLPLERDRWFRPNKTLAEYAEEARVHQGIQA